MKILKWIGVGLISPLILCLFIVLVAGLTPVLFFFLLYIGYLRLFVYLRNDPKVKLKPLINIHKDKPVNDLATSTQYIEQFTEQMALKSSAELGELKSTVDEMEPNDSVFVEQKLHTIQRTIKSIHAEVLVSLKIIEFTRDDGEMFYLPYLNDEDSQLADYIEAYATLVDRKVDKPFYLKLKLDNLGAYFCMGLLSGGGWLSDQSGQLWSYLSNYRVWMVRYRDKGGDFGFRKSNSTNTARENWFDDPVK